MISIETDAFVKSIEEAKKTIRRKLESMVKGFAYYVAEYAIGNTPIGDATVYGAYYQSRQQSLGLRPIEGFAKGSWQANTSGSFSQKNNYGQGAGEDALNQIKTSVQSYQLGQAVFIGNKGPYILALENNSSQQTMGLGIMQPTAEQISRTYAVNLKNFYDKG